MIGGIGVEAGGIAVEQRADICGQIVIFAGDRTPHVQQSGDIVDRRALRAVEGGHAAPGHRGDFLQCREIIFGMGIGHAIGDIGIGLAENMRHAEFVPDDARFIAAVRRRSGFTDAQGLPNHQASGDQCSKDYQPDAHALKCFHVYFPLGQQIMLDALLLCDGLTI